MSSIRHRMGYVSTFSPATKAVKDRGYLDFIRTLPCVVTGTMPVEAAHVSYAAPKWGSSGRGKGQKASDRFALPLCPDQHRKQHSGNEKAFWRDHNIDPHAVCVALHSAYKDLGPCEAGPVCETIIAMMRSEKGSTG